MGTPPASVSSDQIKRVQRSARGGGEWATGGAWAPRSSREFAGKTVGLTRLTMAGKAAMLLVGGAGLIGCRAELSETTQQAIGAQQASESMARCASGGAQQCGAGRAIGGCKIAAQTDNTNATLPSTLYF